MTITYNTLSYASGTTDNNCAINKFFDGNILLTILTIYDSYDVLHINLPDYSINMCLTCKEF